MKYSFTTALTEHYSEVDQTNPLRWCVVFEEETGKLVPQSGWIKCKDFFNDLIAAGHGNGFSIYSFNSAKMKTNQDFVGMVVKNCTNYFLDNIKSTGLDLKAEFSSLETNQVYIKFPKKSTFSTAFDVSLATYAIRLCNVDQKISSWEDLFSSANIKFDQPVNSETIAWVKSKKFNAIPQELRKFPIASAIRGTVFDLTKSKSTSTIHNNGIQAYYYHTKALGLA